MTPIPRRNVIALQMQRDVLERHRISIDIQRSDRIRIIAIQLGSLQLVLEKLGKV
jgi:hypothetical protein